MSHLITMLTANAVGTTTPTIPSNGDKARVLQALVLDRE
jgi:hypothetical protein